MLPKKVILFEFKEIISRIYAAKAVISHRIWAESFRCRACHLPQRH